MSVTVGTEVGKLTAAEGREGRRVPEQKASTFHVWHADAEDESSAKEAV